MVRTRHREALRSPNSALDPYRDRIAELRLDGKVDAFLTLHVPTMWARTEGRLWWKRWTGPSEALAWGVTFLSDGSPSGLFGDGLERESTEGLDSILAELDSGSFKYAGETYAVRWLTGRDLAEAMDVVPNCGRWPSADDYMSSDPPR